MFPMLVILTSPLIYSEDSPEDSPEWDQMLVGGGGSCEKEK